MNSETTFRIILAAVLVSNLSISIFYRRRARKQGGTIARRSEGPRMLVLRCVVGLPLWLVVIAYAVNPGWVSWFALPVPAWLRWVAAAVAIATVPMLYWVFHSLGSSVSETVLTKQRQELVTSGPYQWVRHPLYTVGFLLMVCFGLLAANGLILLLSLLALPFFPAVTAKEEAMLIEKFGDRYRDYMGRSGRFLPRF